MLFRIDTVTTINELSRSYVTTSEAEQASGLSAIYLRALLRKGILEGFRPSRDWFIYKDSLEKFLATPRKPGPKGPRKKNSNELSVSRSPSET